MEALRVEGNALFAAKQYAEAMAKYSEALSLGDGELSAAEASAQRVLLWSNRAACALPLERFDDAIADCTRALEVDAQNEKARYRRAQAYVGLAKYTQAFQDVRLVLAVNPNNKAVVALARKIKDVVSSDVNGLQKALDAVSKGTESDIVAQRSLTEEALKFLELKCVQELTSVPRELEEKGGLVVLWRAANDLLEVKPTTDKIKDAASVLLSHVVSVLSIVASASLPLAAKVFERGGDLFYKLLTLLHDQIQRSYASAASSSASSAGDGAVDLSSSTQKHIVKLAAFVFKHLMLASDDDTAIRTVLKGLLDGLRSRDVELQISGLDGLLHFVSTSTIPEGATKEDDAIAQRKVRFGTLVHEVGLFPLLHETAAIALHLSTPQQPRYDVLLSRLPLVFTQCLAQLASNESVLQTLVKDYGATPVLAATPHDRTLLEKASASCLLLSALFLSNAKLALWAVQQSAGNDGTQLMARLGEFLVASRLFDDARARTRRFQEIWVDCVASVCGVENGTSCVPASLRVEIHKMLRASLEDDDLVLRASALSIQIKIAVVEKAFESVDTPDAQFLIAQIFDVLAKAHAHEAKAQDQQLYWSGASPKERGIEALSYVVTLTPVKDALVTHPKAIQSVFDVDFGGATGQHKPSPAAGHAHTHVGYRSNVYYGIGYILHHLLTSESTLKKKQMEGMELTPDQYEELQKALRQKSVLDDGDSTEQVHVRVTKLVNTPSVLTTLVKLLKYATTQSMNVLEMAVLSALHAAEVPDVRGKLVQSGVFQALIPLAMHALAQAANKTGKKPPVGTKLSTAAGHALAKILISTNPNLVSSASLLSSVRPLLELCKGETQLLQFESLMALTNIASVSDETKNRIVSEPQGLSTLQYLQFSEHELVRRAATETICNLLPNDQIIEKIFMNEEKLRLWLAFASVEEEQEDFETARAAAGALAMVSQVPQVSWLLMEHGALPAFARVLELSLHEDTVHRALFAMENMLQTLTDSKDDAAKAEPRQLYVETVKTELKEKLIQSLKQIAVGGKHAPPTRDAAQSCLGALVQCIGK
jgi:protein unc-45